jgi:hypothetical protein
LDLDGLRRPEISFWSVWQDSELVGCGALKHLDARHAGDQIDADCESTSAQRNCCHSSAAPHDRSSATRLSSPELGNWLHVFLQAGSPTLRQVRLRTVRTICWLRRGSQQLVYDEGAMSAETTSRAPSSQPSRIGAVSSAGSKGVAP